MARLKYCEIAGFFLFMALTLFLSTDIPPAVCNDGWKSPSIGATGACSHHGGVNYHLSEYLRAAIISAAAGFFAFLVGSIIERHLTKVGVDPIDVNLLGPTSSAQV